MLKPLGIAKGDCHAPSSTCVVVQATNANGSAAVWEVTVSLRAAFTPFTCHWPPLKDIQTTDDSPTDGRQMSLNKRLNRSTQKLLLESFEV